MRKHRSMIGFLAAMVMGLNFVILGILFYMLFWPVQFPIIYNEPFPVSPSVVYKGEVITYTIELEKFKDYPVEAHQSILCVDGNLIPLAPIRSNFPVGRHTVNISVIIPDKSSFSQCYVELNVTYHINALRQENKIMNTRSFHIVEKI